MAWAFDVNRLPTALAIMVAVFGGFVTSVVLFLGVLSLTASTTEAHLLSLASAVVVLPLTLVLSAIGVYVARRVYVTLRPPLTDDPDETD